ncbi:MAG: class I SAM-dependent methyltransferase [Tissierellaceae bacterium]|nr:class I SAM-dependent methyltransferase [Tissierellaceae bacterium]
MDLSNRLLEITKFVPKDSSVADIGTDHGYIPVYLIQNNISKNVIASDISSPSLDKTIEYVNQLDLNEKISPRLGDGLNVVKPNEVDTVIIAGMGGVLISKILEENKDTCNTIETFILQPMVASKELREYLIHNGYMIVDESLAKEGKRFYEIIVAKKGKGTIQKDIYYEIGHKLIEKNHPLLREFIYNKKKSVMDIIAKLITDETVKTKTRYKELTEILEEYREVEREVESK